MIRRFGPVLAAITGLLAVIVARYGGPPAPAPELRCDHPHAPDDCFVEVPAAEVLLGAQAEDPHAPGHDPDAGPEEGPPVRVRVDRFWIQRTESTAATWRACVRTGACRPEDVAAHGVFATPLEPDPLRDRLPVVGISWFGAADLCAFLGGRLPTEAEWERAARGLEGHRWPWGDDARCPASIAEVAGREVLRDGSEACQLGGPVPVDELEASGPLRLAGMAGNAWEWTADVFGPHPRAPGEPLPGGTLRAQRGGSWLSATPAELRATVRVGLAPEVQLNDVGVRCVVGPPLR